jgi:hypothetical protein
VAGRSLLVLEEQPRQISRRALEAHGLTRREVLAWVAEGKTSPEIAANPRAEPPDGRQSPRAHLCRLGVETRTAAARIALIAR